MKIRYNFIDISGKTFGYLTAIEHLGKSVWKFKCICGKVYSRLAAPVRYGSIKSCGCKKRDMCIAAVTTHNMCYSSEHMTWASMKSRCYNPKKINYERYGGRGITVCDRWINSFSNFFEDMGPKPSRKHSIERKNNSLGYFPENCIWARPETQNRNKRNNIFLTHNGETLSLIDWSKRQNISYHTIHQRLTQGYSHEEAIMIPLGVSRKAYQKSNKS